MCSPHICNQHRTDFHLSITKTIEPTCRKGSSLSQVNVYIRMSQSYKLAPNMPRFVKVQTSITGLISIHPKPEQLKIYCIPTASGIMDAKDSRQFAILVPNFCTNAFIFQNIYKLQMDHAHLTKYTNQSLRL